MANHTQKQRVLDIIAASAEPMTVQELVDATNINSSGVYILVYKLHQEGKLKKGGRIKPGTRRGLTTYCLRTHVASPSPLEQHENEIPDDAWWAEQKARGFTRPEGRACPRTFNGRQYKGRISKSAVAAAARAVRA